MKLMLDDKVAREHGLNANEACVFAAVLKCTKSGRGWYANYRDLAQALPFVINRMTVSRAVQKLLNLGLIEERDNALFTNNQSQITNAQFVHNDAQNVQQNAQNVLPPNNPPIIYNKTMKRNENIACASARTANEPSDPLFEEFLKEYTLRVGNIKFENSTLAHCRSVWQSQNYPEWKKKMLVAKVKSGEWCKPRLDWTLDDFDPKPYNYNGAGVTLPTDIRLVSAKFNGEYGIYAEQTANDFQMENIKPFNFTNV